MDRDAYFTVYLDAGDLGIVVADPPDASNWLPDIQAHFEQTPELAALVLQGASCYFFVRGHFATQFGEYKEVEGADLIVDDVQMAVINW